MAGSFPRAGQGSHSQQDDCVDILDDPIRGTIDTDTPSSTMHGVGIDAVANKVKKKKKSKPFQGLSGPRPCEGGLSAGTHVKVFCAVVSLLNREDSCRILCRKQDEETKE